MVILLTGIRDDAPIVTRGGRGVSTFKIALLSGLLDSRMHLYVVKADFAGRLAQPDADCG